MSNLSLIKRDGQVVGVKFPFLITDESELRIRALVLIKYLNLEDSLKKEITLILESGNYSFSPNFEQKGTNIIFGPRQTDPNLPPLKVKKSPFYRKIEKHDQSIVYSFHNRLKEYQLTTQIDYFLKAIETDNNCALSSHYSDYNRVYNSSTNAYLKRVEEKSVDESIKQLLISKCRSDFCYHFLAVCSNCGFPVKGGIVLRIQFGEERRCQRCGGTECYYIHDKDEAISIE